MNAARRGIKRRDWPTGLREPRPGYFAWQHPHTGKVLPIGRVPLATAKAEAQAANMHIANLRPTLLDRLTGATNTVAGLLDKMPTSDVGNTAKSRRSIDKIIRQAMGGQACALVSVADCAEVLEGLIEAGKLRSAQAVRSRMIALFKRGQALGWMESNPAEATETPRPEVQRARLTLDMWRAIYAAAPAVTEWLQHAMEIAIVTGADRATISALSRDDVSLVADTLTIKRTKTAKSTGMVVEIPLALRLDALGLTLRDVVKRRTSVVSRLLVHHVRPWGNAPAGSLVHPDAMSDAFTKARKLAGIPDVVQGDRKAPTFYEQRSLAKRLYEDQGGVDTKALLGHTTDKSAATYADPRGVAPVRVKIA